MTERGVIAVDRGVFTHPRFAAEPFTEREAWIWLISQAAFKEHPRRVGALTIKLRRGQVAHSLRFMAERWQWSVKRVRRFLEMLEKTYGPDDEAMIDASIDTGITVVTIRKYNSYQRWLRLSETPYAELPGTGLGTPKDTATTTAQSELNLYPTSAISDDPTEKGTATTTEKDTATTTGGAQEGHKRESIASLAASAAAEPPGPKITTITDWDLKFSEHFLTTAGFNELEIDLAKGGFAAYPVVWRTRGYDMAWALGIAAEIAHDHPGRPFSYYAKAVEKRQDERMLELARAAHITVTPPCTGNGHVQPTTPPNGGSVLNSFDRLKSAIRENRSRAAGGPPEAAVRLLPAGPLR